MGRLKRPRIFPDRNRASFFSLLESCLWIGSEGWAYYLGDRADWPLRRYVIESWMVEQSMGVRQAREVSSSQFLSGAWPYPDPRAAMTRAAATRPRKVPIKQANNSLLDIARLTDTGADRCSCATERALNGFNRARGENP